MLGECNANAKYCRRECLEITGILSAVNESDLENVFCRIVDKAGISIIDSDIKDCHCFQTCQKGFE